MPDWLLLWLSWQKTGNNHTYADKNSFSPVYPCPYIYDITPKYAIHYNFSLLAASHFMCRVGKIGYYEPAIYYIKD